MSAENQSGNSQTNGVKGDCALFLKRKVKDDALITQCKNILDKWSNRIPFSPIKKLGSKTEFLSATELATYKTAVTTQIEKRWLEDHDVPYRGEPLPAKIRPKNEFDPWSMPFKRFADFSEHKQSIDLPDTRQVCDCPRCDATGRVPCPQCKGAGEVICGTCGGHGFNRCRNCSGGQIRKTRKVPRQTNCEWCSGKGISFDKRCTACGGKGTTFKDFEEETYVNCNECAGKGEVRCNTCHSSGKVNCSTCSASGEVTCPNCKGQNQMMAYVTAEQSENPVTSERQYIHPYLPSFKKKDSPTSMLSGPTVFLQDEQMRIIKPDFGEQEASSILRAEVESCCKAHVGHVLRQQIKVESCSVIEYRYQFARNEHVVFLNPSQGFVEDISGPIQKAIETIDALAKKAFDEGKYEDAYRLNLRSLCMDEATEDEKKMRIQIVKRITSAYLMISISTWLLISTAWYLVASIFNQPGCYGPFFGIIPLLLVIYCFARDLGLRLQQPSMRNTTAAMLGIVAVVSGTAINQDSFDWNVACHWLDWMPFAVTTVGAATLMFNRSKERSRRLEIEKYIKTFPNEEALENYVCSLNPQSNYTAGVILGITVGLLLMFGSAAGIAAFHKSRNPNIAGINTDNVGANQASAEKGDVEAQTRLGLRFAKGDGVPKNLKEAAKWFRKAADQGFARAQNDLGVMYDNGEGVPMDHSEALKWFKCAADQGMAQAQNNLGTMYSEGNGVDKNPSEAARWFRKAAQQGLALAQNNLGLACAKGDGEAQNPKEAVKWFSLAAKQGLARAQNNLGVMYDDGNGVAVSPEEAFNWFTKAADQGFPEGQKNLGSMYFDGRGVAKDLVQACKWYGLAAAQGDDFSKSKMADLETTMSQEQIKQAHKMISQFTPHVLLR